MYVQLSSLHRKGCAPMVVLRITFAGFSNSVSTTYIFGRVNMFSVTVFLQVTFLVG